MQIEKTSNNNSQFLIYVSEKGNTKIDVLFQDETAWLSQKQMVELFQTTKQNISLHINNIFVEGELYENSVVKEFLTTASSGKKYNKHNIFHIKQLIAKNEMDSDFEKTIKKIKNK